MAPSQIERSTARSSIPLTHVGRLECDPSPCECIEAGCLGSERHQVPHDEGPLDTFEDRTSRRKQKEDFRGVAETQLSAVSSNSLQAEICAEANRVHFPIWGACLQPTQDLSLRMPRGETTIMASIKRKGGAPEPKPSTTKCLICSRTRLSKPWCLTSSAAMHRITAVWATFGRLL